MVRYGEIWLHMDVRVDNDLLDFRVACDCETLQVAEHDFHTRQEDGL